jgi:hypothetical protein
VAGLERSVRIANRVCWSTRGDIGIRDRSRTREITVADRVADLAVANFDISVLEYDVNFLNVAVNETKAGIEANSNNTGTKIFIIRHINNSITGFIGRVAVLEGRPDYSNDIRNINNSIVDLQSQIDSIIIPVI